MAVVYRIVLLAIALCFIAEINGNSSKSIRIADTCEENENKIVLNRNALARILLRPEIEDKRLMIVSIVGSMRKAKSFIMNYLKRYLTSEGWKNDDWMGDSKRKNNDGFTWRKGVDKETVGIDIFGEIFTVRDSEGKEVVVLLMDTQGLFDTDTTVENNVRLFAYSNLASSLQILNFHQLVEERDLQSLQLSVDFAGMAANIDEDIFKLPELLVLVQNWADEKKFEFGCTGGKKYLDYLLAPRERNEELNSVRETLLSKFHKRHCCLIPHPGLNVTLTDFTGANEELGDDYLHHVQLFVESIFKSKELAIKMWQGEPMTPRMLYNFLIEIDEALQSDGMPKVETLAEAYARSHYANQYEKCLKFYSIEMKRLGVDNGNIVKDVDLLATHQTSQKNAVSTFESTKRLGSDAVKRDFRNRLDEEIANRFQETKKDMEQRKRKFVWELQEKYFKQYSADMEKIMNRNSVGLNEFESTHRKNLEISMRSFGDDALVCDSFASEGALKLQSTITDDFQRRRQSIVERINAQEAQRKLEIEKKNKLEAERKAREEQARREEAERQLKHAKRKKKRRFGFRIGPFKISF